MEGPVVRGASDVYPILAIELAPTLEESTLAGIVGTGFRRGADILVTCWHCVRDDRYTYVVTIGQSETGGGVVYPLTDVAEDENGSDLATARIDPDLTSDSTLRLRLSEVGAPATRNVWTYGFPLPRERRREGGTVAGFEVDARTLRGYVTRSFAYKHPVYGETPSYELDMPAPAGLSGAPLMLDPGNQVIGVMYGENDVETIEAFASIDPETRQRTPEVIRVVSFALAHFTSTLHALRGPATHGRPLVEYLASATE